MSKQTHQTLEFFRADISSHVDLPYADTGVRAGFPSPAQDFMEYALDLNKELIRHPASTFLARVQGDSMKDAGVYDGDLLVIDKSLPPFDGAMAVCYVDGEFTLKFIKINKNGVWLVPANETYHPIRITGQNNFLIWGIVTYSVHNQKRKFGHVRTD